MTRRAAARQADLARIFRAAKAAEVRVAVEIRTDGTIRVEQVEASQPEKPQPVERKREIVL